MHSVPRFMFALFAATLLFIGGLQSGAALAYTPGYIYTVAGNGVQGYSGDNGLATSAQINGPLGIAVDGAGNLYITDQNNERIRKVASSGVITTVAGTGVQGYSGDNGSATLAQIYQPQGVAVDSLGNLYIADRFNSRIRKVASNGTITTVAGTGVTGYSGDNGLATSAQISYPLGVAVDGTGNLYIADYYNHRIRKVAPNGVITTVAGTGVLGFSGDNGPATSAQINYPQGLAVDGTGNLYISDAANHRIRKVAPNGIITTVAGTGVAGYSGDNGSAISAQLTDPYGVAVDGAGNLYFAGNARIRKVAANGIITTVAGSGVLGYSGDNGAATSAQLKYPYGVVVDSTGNLWISDFGNHTVRMIAGASSTCDTTTPYNQGYAAGQTATQAACKANPASCGITTAGTGTSTGGHATYNPTANTVHIPFLDVPTVFGGASSVYEIDLTLIPNTNPLQLKLQNAKQVQ